MYTDLINTLLEKRGIKNNKDKEKFLNPDWDRDLFDSSQIKDIDKAITRIKTAIDNNEKIVIYSDYDCDGIPGAVILYDFLQKVENNIQKRDNSPNYSINFINYIPHRHNEGYGIHQEAVKKFIKDKVSLMITVDLGITNLKEIQFAQENNIDVIVTDHHIPLIDKTGEQILPPAFAVINTKRNDCNYGEKMLCGCATAWKLVNAFLVKYGSEYNIAKNYEKWWLDMVGISTIADMVPLVGENRLLAKYGIEVLRKSPRPGLQKMLTNSKVIQKDINETDIGFAIAPRLNAAGRMSNPREAFLALLNNKESVLYAERLEQYNKDRKKETNNANQNIDFVKFEKDKIIIVGDKTWSPGVLGLIANKIAETTGKTTFVWGQGEDKNIMKGSVRSGNDGANVVELMSLCSEYLEMFGGHEEAGGFAILEKNIDNFQKLLNKEYDTIKNTFKPKIKDITRDLKIKNTDLNNNLYYEINKLAPFGIANKKPVIEVSGEIVSHKLFGDRGQHLEIILSNISLIKFNINSEEVDKLLSQNSFVGEIEWDNYKKKIRIKML